MNVDHALQSARTAGYSLHSRAVDRHSTWARDFAAVGELDAAIDELHLIQALAEEVRGGGDEHDDPPHSCETVQLESSFGLIHRLRRATASLGAPQSLPRWLVSIADFGLHILPFTAPETATWVSPRTDRSDESGEAQQ